MVPQMIASDSKASLASAASGLSQLSLFEQHLPIEPRRFLVDLTPPRAATATSSTGHVASSPRMFRPGTGTYDFTVLPQVRSPRFWEALARETSRSSLHNMADPVTPERLNPPNANITLQTDRAFFRHQRVSHFSAGRHFPALVNPRILPSFQCVAEMAKTLQEIHGSEPPGPFFSPFPDMESRPSQPSQPSRPPRKPKRYRKKDSHNILPFIPSGKRRKSIPHRNFGGVRGAYDSLPEARREEDKASRHKRLYGAFLPSCAKPRQRTLGPLSYCRSHVHALAPLSRQRIAEAEAVQESLFEDDDQAGIEDSQLDQFSSEFGEEQVRRESKFRGDRRSLSNHYIRSSTLKIAVDDDEFGSPLIPQHIAEESLLFPNADAEKKKEEKKEEEKVSVSVFKKLADEGKVHRDDLPKALELVGFVAPNMDWLNEAYSKISKYVSIGLDDFLRFLKGYQEVQSAFYKIQFDSCDDDGSGTLEAEELMRLMTKMGIQSMNHVVAEVIGEVDRDGNGDLDFTEFECVMDILRRREGFSKDECDEIEETFTRFDREKDGTMDTAELGMALQFLGFSVRAEVLESLMKEIDEDASGQIDQKEWFICMRKVREAKIDRLQSVMAMDGDGKIQPSELLGLLRAMNFVPDYDSVQEAVEEAGIAADDDDLDLSELWRILTIYRRHEGLNRSVLEQVDIAFKRYCNEKGDEAEVEVVDIGKFIRCMGYVIDFEVLQNLVNKVDIDLSGNLDKQECMKLVRMIHEKDFEIMKLAFEEAMQAAAEGASISTSSPDKSAGEGADRRGAVVGQDFSTVTVWEAKQALTRVGCQDSPEVMDTLFSKEAIADDRIDIYEFGQAAVRSRSLARAAFRQNGGFTEDQMAELRVSFNKYDADGSGEISGDEVIQLFQTEFPAIANDPARRPQLTQLLQETDEDGTGSLDFMDFLRIMRQLRDMRDKLRLSKELEAVSTTKFTPPEVQQFRELFITAGHGEQELGFEEIKELLKCIVPMGAKNVEQLKHKFDDMAAKQCGTEGDDEMLDFPEFLWLMRDLIDSNFANISGNANALVEESAS